MGLVFDCWSRVEYCWNVNEIMVFEVKIMKGLYKLVVNVVSYGEFIRVKKGIGIDIVNRFLDYGNYFIYGLVVMVVWVLGLFYGLVVLYGKMWRGGLVFDIVDLVKDLLILF